MDHKSSVVKSKSSNSAITTKSDKSNKNKKTRSNAEFPPATLKKRGVYVEKKNTKLNLTSRDKSPSKQGVLSPNRPPPRPRRGQKKFLASVLTILSKNTASTQYPDGPRGPDATITVEKDKPIRVKRMRRFNVETAEKGTQDAIVKKKPKFRSRVLNDMMGTDTKKVVILQNKKEIIHTPSNYSNRSYKDISDDRYMSLPPLVNYDCDEEYDDEANTMKNLVAKSKAATEAHLQKDVMKKCKDPITLVSQNKQKDEKGLYNFFVDLLETTFSVYNVKPEYNGDHTPSDVRSKVVFEIDENVAEKLNVSKNRTQDKTKEEAPIAQNLCCIRNKRYCVNDRVLLDRSRSPPVSSKPDTIKRKYRRNLKSESFFYQNPKFKINSPTQSVVMNKKSFHKRNRKQTFINMLKEQLRMEDCSFEEPQNLHQALKIIARNKRRNRKAIHFADDVTKTDDNDHRKPECVFKRRKVISSSTKSTKRNHVPNERTFRTDTITRKFSDTMINPDKKLPKSGYSTEDDKTESYHSLEVHGYDYEATPNRRMIENINKKIVFARKVSSECFKEDFTPNSSIFKFSNSLSSSDANFGSDSLPSFGKPIRF